MKKLRKQNLDELAQSMPVLNDSEQQCCVGGTYFFDMSGNFLEQYGGSDTIRIITEDELGIKKIKAGLSDPGVSKDPDEWGVGAYTVLHGEEATDKLLDYVINHSCLAGTFGDVQIKIQSGLGMQSTFSIIGGCPTIYIDYSIMSLESVGRLVSTLKHERAHAEFYSGVIGGHIQLGSGDNVWIDENRAYMEQTLDPGFLSLPRSYRNMIAMEWIKQVEAHAKWLKNNKNIYYDTTEDENNIRRMCGID